MCLINAFHVMTAEEAIPVFKIMYYNESKVKQPHTIFHTQRGLSLELDEVFEGSKLTQILLNESYFFNIGYGYHCFDAKELAGRYKELLLKFFDLRNVKIRSEHLVIVNLFVPKGVEFANGIIASESIGAGLKAIRTDKFEPKLKKWPYIANCPNWVSIES